MTWLSEIMLNDHCQIEQLLNRLRVSMEVDDGDKEENFQKFKWALEKHFFIEENAVLDLFKNPHIGVYREISGILKDHDRILRLLKEKENQFEETGQFEMSDLIKVLLKHKQYEDKHIYPLLDTKLSPELKNKIIHRIDKENKRQQFTKINNLTGG